jgi:putative FmdB family regulatory protein
MPTYDYRCRDCGQSLEVQQSIHDDPLTECPACGGTLKKVFSAVGISFKGSGFYKTDSRNGASSRSGGESTSTESTSGDSTASSSSPTEAATASTPAA